MVIKLAEAKWYQFIDIFTSIDEKTELTNQLLRELLRVLRAQVPVTVTVPPTEVERERIIREQVVKLPPEIFPTIDPIVNSLLLLNDTLKEINEKLEPISEFYKPQRTYYFESFSITSDSPKDYKILDLLKRLGKHGWISCDTGSLKVKINENKDIELNAGESQSLDYFEVETILLSTTTSATGRLHIW